MTDEPPDVALAVADAAVEGRFRSRRDRVAGVALLRSIAAAAAASSPYSQPTPPRLEEQANSNGFDGRAACVLNGVEGMQLCRAGRRGGTGGAGETARRAMSDTKDHDTKRGGDGLREETCLFGSPNAAEDGRERDAGDCARRRSDGGTYMRTAIQCPAAHAASLARRYAGQRSTCKGGRGGTGRPHEMF